jgi:hypothetical protein
MRRLATIRQTASVSAAAGELCRKLCELAGLKAMSGVGRGRYGALQRSAHDGRHRIDALVVAGRERLATAPRERQRAERPVVVRGKRE